VVALIYPNMRQAYADPSGGTPAYRTMTQVDGKALDHPILLLGNESLPPMSFVKGGKPHGIVVDIAKALAAHMHRPVEVRLMDWTEAQQRVLEGQADALLQFNPNPERLALYDFSTPLLTSEFTIFTYGNRFGITDMRDLRGLKVGVEKNGLPALLLKGDPQIGTHIVTNVPQAFEMLVTGAVDAVVVDRWVGSYVVAERRIRGVQIVEPPIERSNSAIAVKKGNLNLLKDINTRTGRHPSRRHLRQDRLLLAL